MGSICRKTGRTTPERRETAHVPEDVEFRTKPQIALAQIEAAVKDGVARGVVLTDVAYGCDGTFRAGVTAMGLPYAVGVQSTLSVWPPGEEPLPSKPWSGRGRKPSRLRHDADHRPVSAKELAIRLPAESWNGRRVTPRLKTSLCLRASPPRGSG